METYRCAFIVLILTCTYHAINADRRQKTNSTGPATRQVVYNVQHLHQSCAGRGRVVCTSQSDAAGLKSAVSDQKKRIDAQAASINALLQTVEELKDSDQQRNIAMSAMETMINGLRTEIKKLVSTPTATTETASGVPTSPPSPRIVTAAAEGVTTVVAPENTYPSDCTEVFSLGQRQTGVYWIQPRDSVAFQAFCDMSNGGWTVLMRRFDGSQYFFLFWEDYKTGFGNLSREHWLGNDQMHHLTNTKNYTLRVDFTYWSNGASGWAEYRTFKVDGEEDNYTLHVGGYTGSHGDRLRQHNGYAFSTRDQDHDTWRTESCAQVRKGGHWYHHCFHSNPTGLYKQSGDDSMQWTWYSSLKAMTLKIKPA